MNRNVNTNVNQNVNRNVSREPTFRYTTILQMKMKENVNVSREPDLRYTTILLKKMKRNERKCTKSYRNTHTYRKIENPGKSWYREFPGYFLRFHTRFTIKTTPILQFFTINVMVFQRFCVICVFAQGLPSTVYLFLRFSYKT